MRISSAGITNVGRKRQNNEDNYLVNDRLGLYVVCDGMGGHAGGEYASQVAVTTIEEVLANIRDENVAKGEIDDQITQEKLKYAVRLAGKRIYDLAQAEPEFRGMGTTAVILVFLNGMAYMAHVGDSRGYLIRGGEITQRTEDHSWVNEQIKAGLITAEAAKHHRFRNIITRSLGFQEEVEIDTQVLRAEPGDIYLLCSDGLSNLVTEDELREMLVEKSFQQTARDLIDLANDRGGDDNITLVLARVDSVTE
ncbi:MAG TPA: Stp1/IreP family PP2C-type Ser/Thr phosphatase [Deltaproteobacteria bacterium]|nr:protein phosphatase [Deltaproteobacteria bacterium]HCP47368.1 Stp1/IreP family PP2C-type Ser/Thr phosphatase [Deltaproteobacteria bacterium]